MQQKEDSYLRHLNLNNDLKVAKHRTVNCELESLRMCSRTIFIFIIACIHAYSAAVTMSEHL
jgi:hypothetical protein